MLEIYIQNHVQLSSILPALETVFTLVGWSSDDPCGFQVVFNCICINQYSIDWSEVIDKKDVSKALHFFLPKSLLFCLQLVFYAGMGKRVLSY